MKILFNSCKREVDRIGMRVENRLRRSRRKVGGHAASKFRRAVSVKRAVKDNRSCNIAEECMRLKTGS